MNTTLIAGVHNYCDRWCERCRFQQRCTVFTGRDPSPEHAGPPPAWMEEIFNATPTEAEIKEFEAEEEARDKQLAVDPLVLGSREYAEITHNLTEALRPMVESDGDAVVLSALDVIQWHTWLIAVKAHRAAHGQLWDRDEGEHDVQSDANGTAKLLRVILAESRDAWSVLMQAGHAIADGVPGQMVKRLEALDESVAARFPRAMEFVRAGFDDEPA